MTHYPNEVIKIDRKYIEWDLKNIESSLLNKNGELDDSTFDSIAHELFENIDGLIKGCYSKVEREIARFERNMGASDANPHYRLYSKVGRNGDFELEGTFTNLSDARDTIRDNKHNVSDRDMHKITEVKNGIEGDKNYYQKSLF